MERPKIKVYGLRMTRRTYVVVQLAGFFWLLGLYLWWRSAGLEGHPIFLVRHLDGVLLVLYFYAVAETFFVLRKFNRS